MTETLSLVGLCVVGLLIWAVAEILGEAFLGLVGYWTARLLLPLLTGGRVRASGLRDQPKGLDAAGKRAREDGCIILSIEFTATAGLAIWISALAMLIVIAFGRSGFATGC
ncbi:hypothetical protein [Hansschlegelia sp. KR7-227]|uniref:hypothetical protein n=1 Tax=Hansschlegelia sp. KR7-227 TaxID=3400914 RepID=UPI003C05AE48